VSIGLVNTACTFSWKSILELLHTARQTDRQTDMLTLICALLQFGVEAVPQSCMFIMTMSILHMLLVEIHCSDGRTMDILFIIPMEYE
jgi:hypothetical protein